MRLREAQVATPTGKIEGGSLTFSDTYILLPEDEYGHLHVFKRSDGRWMGSFKPTSRDLNRDDWRPVL